jgi:hypothetical protein
MLHHPDIKAIWSLLGLCKFFWNYIQIFTIITASLFKITQQDLATLLEAYQHFKPSVNYNDNSASNQCWPSKFLGWIVTTP